MLPSHTHITFGTCWVHQAVGQFDKFQNSLQTAEGKSIKEGKQIHYTVGKLLVDCIILTFKSKKKKKKR